MSSDSPFCLNTFTAFMVSPDELKTTTQTRRYWDRHGTSTLVVLLLVLLLSALLWPVPPAAAGGVALAGIMFFAGAELVERDHWGLGTLLVGASLVLAALAFVNGWSARSALFWVQGGSLFFVVPGICSLVKDRLHQKKSKPLVGK